MDDVGEHIQKLSSHFNKVLNVSRSLQEDIIGMVPNNSHVGRSVDWGPPTVQRVRKAIKRLRGNKTNDLEGVQAELLHAIADEKCNP